MRLRTLCIVFTVSAGKKGTVGCSSKYCNGMFSLKSLPNLWHKVNTYAWALARSWSGAMMYKDIPCNKFFNAPWFTEFTPHVQCAIRFKFALVVSISAYLHIDWEKGHGLPVHHITLQRQFGYNISLQNPINPHSKTFHIVVCPLYTSKLSRRMQGSVYW